MPKGKELTDIQKGGILVLEHHFSHAVMEPLPNANLVGDFVGIGSPVVIGCLHLHAERIHRLGLISCTLVHTYSINPVYTTIPSTPPIAKFLLSLPKLAHTFL